MVQAVWFDFGAERPGRLLLVVHHLAVDIVSWSVIGDDLADLGGGNDPLPPSTSFRTYARRLADHAAHADVTRQSFPSGRRSSRGPTRSSAGGRSTPRSTSAAISDTLSVTLPARCHRHRSSARFPPPSTPA